MNSFFTNDWHYIYNALSEEKHTKLTTHIHKIRREMKIDNVMECKKWKR